MKQKFVWQSALVAAVVALGLVAQPSVSAAAELTRAVHEKLQDAQKGSGAAAVNAAKEALAASKTANDKETSLRMLFYVASKASDYRTAMSAAEGLLEGGFAKSTERLQYSKQVAALAVQLRDYGKANSAYQRYLELRGAGASEKDYFDAAQIANISGNYSQVMAFGDKVAASGRPRSEKLLLLQYSAAGKLGQAGKQRSLMEELAKRFMKGEYLANMIAIQIKAKGDKSMILNIYRLAADHNGLKGQELGLSYVQDLVSAGAMGEADAFLKKAGLKKDDKVTSLTRQATAFAAEEKKGLATKDKESRAGKNGETDYRVAMAYFGQGQYSEAAEAARRALQPDHAARVKRIDEVQMLLGMALVRSKKGAEARGPLSDAKKDPRMAPAADLWLAAAQ